MCFDYVFREAQETNPPKYEYKADAKSLLLVNLTKKKYSLSQINDWYNTPEVQKFHNEGYTGKWFAKLTRN